MVEAATSTWQFACRPESENPTLREIKGRQDVERAQKAAEEAVMATQYLAGEARQKADRTHKEAQLRQQVANCMTAQAAEVTAQMKAQLEEAESISRHAQHLSGAADAAREAAERFAREAQDEHERAQRMQRDAETAIEIAKGEAEEAQRVAIERCREADDAKAQAEEMARAAQEANKARDESERRLTEGIQPIVMPSAHELAEAKWRVQYREDCFHIAVAGISGSGKSSLVNAFRGLRNRDPGAAMVGLTERMLQTSRYHDSNPNNPCIWYELPGAGMLRCRDWQYFNDQDLYVFDCIILLFDTRLTMTDVAILTNARRFKIPTFIVRSKADRWIRNIMTDINSEDEDGGEHHGKLYNAARKQLVDMTRGYVQHMLEDANLPDQRVYIVSNTALFSMVLNRMPKVTIDELELLNDLANEAHARRKARPTTG